MGRALSGDLLTMSLKIACALAALTATVAPALAQNDVCVDPQSGMINQTATDGWRQFQAAASRDAMQQIAGVWYGEIRSPSTGQIDYHTNSFEPSGLYQYQSKVCSSDGLCSDYQGHGFWATQAGADQTMVTMTIVSDLSRTNLCGIFYARFLDPATLQDTNGITWTKVQ